MFLLIDNYDSFVYNLYQLAGSFVPDVMVARSDAVTADEVESLAPEAILLSPGPGRPEDAGVCPALVRRFAGKIPIFASASECRLSAPRSAGAYPTRGRSCTARYRKFRSRRERPLQGYEERISRGALPFARGRRGEPAALRCASRRAPKTAR